jgi:nucleoside-diphosphate-sugar epimerase
MEKKHVLVTGGAGFIGSHVAELALSRGYDVTVLDNLSQGKREWVPEGAHFIEGDVTMLEHVREAVGGMDGVFHLAAMSRVLPSIGGGPSTALFSAEQNITGTLNVLAAAAENGAPKCKVIYSASSTYYGTQPAPHFEDGPSGLSTPYAVSKYVGELYCKQFSDMFDLPTVCLRYFQVYGPRCPSTGTYAMVSSIFIEQAKNGQPLTIQGDGKQRRDFVHVYDVAKANILAFERPGLGGGVVLNVGRGESHTIQELADLISDNQVYVEARKFDMQETRANMSKFFRHLEWFPEISFVKGTIALKNGTGDFR